MDEQTRKIVQLLIAGLLSAEEARTITDEELDALYAAAKESKEL